MGKVTKKEMPMWAKLGHKKPTTRREFLGYGMIPFAASALVPSALSLLVSPEAHAANCASGSGSMVPFITLNLAGGASMASNFVPFNAAGSPLASYTKMGLGNNTGANALAFQTEMGVSQWSTPVGANVGQMLVGIRTGADAATLANTAVVALCVSSQDDTNSNKFDASGLVYKAGLAGSLIPNLGSRQSSTGLNQMASLINPPPPLVVRSFTDIQNSLAYTRALQTSLTAAQRTKLAGLVANLSTSQARKLAALNSTRPMQSLVECAGIKNVELSGGAPVDPLANAAVSAAWGINAGTGANVEARVFASMVYNGLLGQAGTVSLERGGYDYHDGTRNTGDTRDREAGVVIGRILSTARILGKKCMIYVTSDGSVVSQEGVAPGAVWTSDRGNAGMALMFFYDPARRPATTGSQVGQYKDTQVVDEKFITGNSPELAAQAVFANWAKFNGDLGLFSKVVPSNSALAGAVGSVVKVA
jgi:hypothetical protein